MTSIPFSTLLIFLFILAGPIFMIVLFAKKGGFPGTPEVPTPEQRGTLVYRVRSSGYNGFLRFKGPFILCEMYEEGMLINPLFQKNTWLSKRDLYDVRVKKGMLGVISVEIETKEGEMFQIDETERGKEQFLAWWKQVR